MKLDKLDARIIAALQADGRQTVVELAQSIGLSGTPCARRLKRLEDAGVIQGYKAVICPARVGLGVRAFVQLKLETHSEAAVLAFKESLEMIDEVISCHATTGAYDFMMLVLAPSLEIFGNVILRKLLSLPGVRDVHSSIALEAMKESGNLPLGHLHGRLV